MRARLGVALELVQIDRPDSAARLVAELAALERDGRAAALEEIAGEAAQALDLAQRWYRAASDAAELRVSILRLTLAMLRDLTAREHTS